LPDKGGVEISIKFAGRVVGNIEELAAGNRLGCGDTQEDEELGKETHKWEKEGRRCANQEPPLQIWPPETTESNLTAKTH
jgi:hypothetical protein